MPDGLPTPSTPETKPSTTRDTREPWVVTATMAGSTEQLRDLVEHTVRASEPSAALRALTALRAELDAFERLQVARALDAGSSFAAVAKALGISRQAAH
ncbi:MAG: hypothetical protein ACRDK0_08290, partial [Solirubrobacteraceae bacterium]